MENKKAVKLTDFQKNEENPFMKQAIEGIENHVVKKYKSNSGGDKRAVVALADTETGASMAATELGGIFLGIFMSAMHAKELRVAEMDLSTCFT